MLAGVVMSLDGPVPGIPGAIVRESASLPEHLANGGTIGPFTEAAPQELLFEVPGIARFLVRQGTKVDVEVAANSDRAAVRLFLDSSVRGALIHQRGELPLEAATMVTTSGSAVAICGSSGTGKSTLAAALSRRKWLLLSEGVTRVTWNGTTALAWPGEQRLHLWHDACEALGQNPDALERVRANLEKYYLPVETSAVFAPLEFVIRLRVAPISAVAEVPATQRADFLAACTYRPRHMVAMGLADAHARIVSIVSRDVRAFVLEGARECAIEELANQLCQAVSRS